MKNLHNALLLKHLYQLKNLGYKYTSIMPYQEKEPDFSLPNTMESLKKQSLECHLCELSKSREKVVFGEGSLDAQVMFIGEAPSSMEDSSGKPFLGRSGELLTKMIENVLLIPRAQTYITNLVKCRPPNNQTPTETQAHTCYPYVLKQIEIIQPKIIVTLGASAYHYLSGDQSEITQIRGNIIERDGYILIPTYHPNYLLRNPSAKKEVFEDLKKVKSLLQA